MYKDKFVLSVLHNGSPVKETGSRYNRQVAIPFGSEYKLRLKNKNDRSCAVRLFIDGAPVSNFGDFVVSAGGTVDLERFVTDSMSRGKRFRFVTLDHSSVDDPTRSENGIIRAEFRLAKQPNGINITPHDDWRWFKLPKHPGDGGDWSYYEHGDGSSDTNWSFTYNSSTDVPNNSPQWSNSSGSRGKSKSKGLRKRSAMYSASMNSVVGACAAPMAATEAGATIQGGRSNQSFGYTQLVVEERATILQLKMVGIHQSDRTRTISRGKFCTQCGHKVRHQDRYCGGCGRRI
jgi:hypothetical protein